MYTALRRPPSTGLNGAGAPATAAAAAATPATTSSTTVAAAGSAAGVGGGDGGGGGGGGRRGAVKSPMPEVANGGYVPLSSNVMVGATDAGDEEVKQLLKELECSMGGPHAEAVMRDAVWAIERRALASCDPLSRDLLLEQSIRDALSELSRSSNPKLLLLAVDFIDALLVVPYTNPQQKFTRLCRSLFIVLHCGIEKPAKEAKRVLKRMLAMDLHFSPFDPPLKSFITKELKDNCELALIQLHGRAQQTKAPFVAQFLAVMLALDATAEVNPRYMSGQLRPHAVQLATALAGSSDEVLRRAAYDCLVAIFSHTSAMRHKEVLLESRRVLDDAIRSLNTSHNNESSIISTMQSLRALIISRGVHCMEKQVQILPQLCVLVTEQHRVSKSQAVRIAVCNLVPVIAETDILSAARRTTYCAIIMEPVKNVRDEKNKDLELHNVATFIKNVGYEVLDPTNRTNLDSILLRYITRRETQEECWHLLAAICSNPTRASWRRGQMGNRSTWSIASFSASRGEVPLPVESSPSNQNSPWVESVAPNSITNGISSGANKQQVLMQHMDTLVRRCIPHLANAVLSAELVQYVGLVGEHIPSVSAELQAALETLVDRKLKDEVRDPKRTEGESGVTHSLREGYGSSMVGTSQLGLQQDTAQASTFSGANSAVGRLAQYFLPPASAEAGNGNNTSRIASNGGGNGAGSGVVLSEISARSAGTALQPNLGNNSMSNGTTMMAAAAAGVGAGGSGMSPPQPVGASELKIALEVFGKRQITSVQQLEEVRGSIIHYQRHPDAQVRQQCSTCVVEALSRWTLYAKQHRTSTYSTRVTEILELYLKHVVMELDPKVRLMEVTLLADAVELRSFLLEQRILKTLMSFLHDTSHVREKTMELLIALTQEPRSGPSAESLQRSLLVVVESCVVALEYSTDPRILIRHMSDLQTLAKFSLEPLMAHLHRTFIAFRKQLAEEVMADAIALSILKALSTILAAFANNREVMLQYQEDVVELYMPVVGILRSSTSTSLSHAAIGVLVKMHIIGASPQEWNAPQVHDLLQSITAVYIGATNSTEEELEQVLTLFGQLGAVDPSTKPEAVAKKKDDEAAIQDDADLELTYDYTVIVYRDLSRMIDLSLSETVCRQAMHTLLHLVQTTSDKKELIGGAHAVKAVLQIVKRANDTPSLRIEALHIMAAITSLRHEKISKTLLPEIVVLLEQLWHTHDHALFRAVLDVVSALKPGNLSGKEQSEVWPWLYPRLVDVALQDRTESREFCLRVVGIIFHASYIPPHCISILFPMLMQFVQQFDQLVEVRALSLCVSVHIVCDLKAVQHLSSLLHAIRTLTRHCEMSEDLGPRLSTAMVRDSLKVLAALYPNGKATVRALRERLRDAEEAGSPDPIDSSRSGNDLTSMSEEASELPYLRQYRQQHQRELRCGNHYLDQQDDEGYETYPQGQQDITLFMKHVEFGLRAKDNKWREWLAEFQKNIIVVSPHPVFRMMVDLFDKHEPLRRKLFHPSFKCFYESLNAEHMKKVNEVLNLALRSADSEVVSKCLGLADYLDHNPPNIKEPVLLHLRSLESNETGMRPTTLPSSSEHQGKVVSENYSLDSLSVSLGSPDEELVTREGTILIDTKGAIPSFTSNAQGVRSRSNNNNNTNNNGLISALLSGNEEVEGDFHPVASPITAKPRSSLAASCTRAPPIPNTVNPLFATDSLVEAAQRTHMYDKVMSYLENKMLPVFEKYRYRRRVPKEAVHAVVLPLAWMYSKREMQDSVVGLFRAIRYKSEDEDGFSYELLQWWDVAQSVYAAKVRDLSKSSLVDLEGYVRTLCLCGEWEKTLDFVKAVCPQLAQPSSTIAQSGAMAAWILGEWGDVRQLTERVPLKEKGSAALRLFFQSAAYFHDEFYQFRRDTDAAPRVEFLHNTITRAKIEVDESLKTLLPLSYAHAYENLTLLQHFTEMEEQIAYVKSDSVIFREQLVDRWKRRFAALKPDSLMPSLRSLMVHSLVLQPSEMSEMIVNFCERMGTNYPQLSKWAMAWLQQGQFPRGSHHYKSDHMNPDAPLSSEPSVAIVYIGQVWSEGRRQEAVRMMEKFLEETRPRLEETRPLCYGTAQHRLGSWKQDMRADSFWKSDHRQEVLRHFHEAIRAMPESYEVWHSWGLMNYRVQQRDHSLTPEEQHLFVEAAHQGFVAAICRCAGPSTALPGVMRLLHLWVFHNGMSLLKETVADSVSRIPTDYWVQAIPQLIGHLSNSSHDVREVISMILRHLCEVHSQAVVFPLLVVFMSDDGCGGPQLRRRELAQSIIKHLPKRIRADAELVAKLLIDVSAIPIEKIRENLSAVATAWNPNAEYEEDPEEVRRRLKSVLDIFSAHRRHMLYTVGDIGQYVEMVLDDEKHGDREKASSIVGQLVDEITKHISEKLGKEPQKAMEPLLNLRNLCIAVFGEYDIQYTNFPTIASFSSKLDVIPSKKRPRRIRLSGSNGCMYTYCLKGNEDIRMDERVMQLFGMVNVLLSDAHTPSSAFIRRFPVIPISNNVGLLGWVEHANTINNTICIHRSTISKVRTHQESAALRSYVESFGNWEKLSMIQRTEVLEYIMTEPECEAVDVARAMWHRSNTAEQWLERRTAYTQSLATMSMVGYVMGLGDRHLGNILLCMSTGKIVHIDFGDSFDVGRLRHVLPETIPFRLTRMLTNAMEVFGVNGVFRASCNRTQTILHKNRDSIMALLSAFVHDPIVQHKGKMKNMMEKSRTPQDIAERIRNKLRGTEMAVEDEDLTIFNTVPESARRPDLLYMSNAFNDAARRPLGKCLTTPQQVSMLIDEATRVENFAALYFGWGPLW
ncbi:putative phosphatidylinositol 3-kinase [Trypanosoma grayi]|uniref:putative phosphatidylinositol 3-kinase n=1 Tax=Trypanosoma grayi TaxID=71804 RepID=UPI0004F49630|nr:putative phosphatidylinositol 3-kinase [Trypanosoma grayi]KEG12211.1 putative phosphatidylinositol 3-kinase [Trypanosoma grayi]